MATSPRVKRNSRRGFTLIEMSVVILLMVLFSALVVPNLARAQESRRERAFFDRLLSMAVDARTQAIESQRTVAVRYDESNRQFQATVEEDVAATTSGNTATPPTTNAAGPRAVVAPESVTVRTFRAGTQDQAAAEWVLRFYPDGRADRGGLEFDRPNGVLSIQVDRKGNVTMSNEALKDEESWEAGQLEQRL